MCSWARPSLKAGPARATSREIRTRARSCAIGSGVGLKRGGDDATGSATPARRAVLAVLETVDVIMA
jgi:hypothetical protein